VNKRLALFFLSIIVAGTASAWHPLEPLDTSSPRATMATFLNVTDEVASRYLAYVSSPSRDTFKAAWSLRPKYTGLFDLSNVPPASRAKVGAETFTLIWDVLARVELPPLEEIPDAVAVATGEAKDGPALRWRIPGTEIAIVRIEQGPRTGEFLFSADTVERAKEFYKLAQGLPYVRPMPVEKFYETSRQLTGWMIPPNWVQALPDWAKTLVLGQMLWKWFAILVLFGLTVSAVVWVARWGRRRAWGGTLPAFLRRAVAPVVILALGPVLEFLVAEQINTTGRLGGLPDFVITVASELAVIWLIWLTTSWVAERVITSPRIRSEGLTAQMIRLTARSVGVLTIVALIMLIAHEIGVPVLGLVAGAGAGGIAVALAVRSTLENFVGTLNLYADRPVMVGDFCRYGEDPSHTWMRIGTVEEIGLRSTRIRGLDRTITTIPNAEFANMHIVNLTARERILLNPQIRLRYETTPDQLRVVLANLREMLLAHPRITDDPARVRASGFGESSIDVDVFAYVATADWNEFLAVQEDVVLRIMDIVKAAGAAFALPSRTLYHGRDQGLDPERQEAAGKQVRQWASAHELPFPDFPASYREKIIDTLDYPPTGSPKADRG
jgi:MscS family membrane protein